MATTENGNAPSTTPTQTRFFSGTQERPTVPTFGEDLKNDWRAVTDIFRKKENKKYDPNLGKYNVERPADDAPLGEWISYLRDKSDYENEVAKKRQERNERIQKVGEMFDALSNLYFTTKGAPSWFNPTAVEDMTDKQRERYDKLNEAKRDADQNYLNAYIRQVNADRDRQDRLDAEAREEERWRKDLEAKQAAAEADHAFTAEQNDKLQNFTAEENAKKRKHDFKLQQIKNIYQQVKGGGSKGAPTVLADGDGNQYRIDNAVWKGSMPIVFDALKDDLVDNGVLRSTQVKKLKPADKEDLVKQYWYLNEDVKDLLLLYSDIDPDTMESKTNTIHYDPSMDEGGDAIPYE